MVRKLKKLICSSVIVLSVVVPAAVAAIAAGLATPGFAHLPAALRPHRPLLVVLLNSVGGLLVRTGALRLPTEETAIASACRGARLPKGAACVLDDPASGEDGKEWREGMRMLLASYQADANLTALGHLIASGQLDTWLKARARLIHAWSRMPPGTLSSQVIRSPILIVGLPRTGTTFLLNLLKQDPALRTPLHWELVEPLPGEGEPPLGTAHVAKIQALLDQFLQLLPGVEEVHPMEATMAEECVVTMAHEFASMLFEATFSVRTYNAWLLAKPSHAHVFRWHRKVLQFLQHRESSERSTIAPPRRWVLKTPWYSHGPVLEAAMAEYPDAYVVHTHRGPGAIVGSSASIHAKMYGAGSDEIGLHAIGAEQATLLEGMVASGTATRERWRAERPEVADRVADVQLAELKRAPLEVVKSIYEQFGMVLSTEAHAAMTAWLQSSQVRHGGHHFELASFGLSESEILSRPAFKKYCDTFADCMSARPSR